MSRLQLLGAWGLSIPDPWCTVIPPPLTSRLALEEVTVKVNLDVFGGGAVFVCVCVCVCVCV